MKTVSDKDFQQEVLESNLPTMVKFTADWCGPCQAIQPLLEDIASDLKGLANVVKLDVDESPVTASKYGVRSIPTMLVFKNGEVIANQVGRSAKDKIVAMFGLDAESK